MGEELKTLAKARKELQQLYLGTPDDSLNLTFQDLADVQHKANASSTASPLSKLPSLDFKRSLQAAARLQDHYNHPVGDHDHHHQQPWRHSHHHHHHAMDDQMTRSTAYDDVSFISMASTNRDVGDGGHQSGLCRPWILHSNICTVCTTYIYIFPHWCLVCGRVYYRNCVGVGMGEMTEGRKCIQCLGRRFSQRYIKRAGKVCCRWSYGNAAKQAEVKWAEKGPRRNGERGMVRSPTSRSRAYSGNIHPFFCCKLTLTCLLNLCHFHSSPSPITVYVASQLKPIYSTIYLYSPIYISN